jgi:tetratricopeptide (TPR) repeat protein
MLRMRLKWHLQHCRLRTETVAIVLLGLLLLAFRPVAADDSLDRTIEIYQKLLRIRPHDAELFYRLGDAYIEKGRETGDVTYYSLASQSLKEALKIEPDVGPALRHLAYVLYTLHDFSGASEQAREAIRLDPTDSYSYGVLGDAELETGRYHDAANDYEKMIALRGDLYSYSRRAGLESMEGKPEAAVVDLERAIRDGLDTGKPREAVAWVRWQLGNEFFLLGKFAESDTQYRDALLTDPGYYRALAGLAQVRAAQGKLEEATGLYTRAIAVIPFPEYVAAMGDVYAKMGRSDDARKQRELVEFIGRLNALNQIIYNRVLAYYYADHDMKHQEAVDLASAELRLRKDIYGFDIMAWALCRNGKAPEALSYMKRALRLGTKDPKLYFHAGMIFLALKRNDQARVYIQRALALNPHFQPLLDDVAAREYARLSDKQKTRYAALNAN